MQNYQNINPTAALLTVAASAFPQRKEFQTMEFDGTYAQAWQAVARLVAMDEMELAGTLAPFYGVLFSGPLDAVEPDALASLRSAFCQQHNILPLHFREGVLRIATAKPFDQSLAERVRFVFNKPFQWVLAPPESIELATLIALDKEAARQAAGDALIGDAGGLGEQHAVVKLGRGLLASAIEQRASDLHIQPFMGAAMVRIRVDGALRRLMTLSDAVAAALIRHFKARSGMDSTNSMIPQDGRMSTVVGRREFDMRVSVLPASQGERLVIRFLEQGKVQRLHGAGFSHAALQTLRRAVRRPAGLILLTGPTGCGKTSTLYAMLSEVNNSAVNIMTVENPVEYRIPGISQVEVNEKAGRTFATSLRSILRQDPDVVLIGEIRDKETADIALQAALTGHLVLSTLHTNDALTAIPRLLDLGVQASVLADSLSTVAAQRLCRKLCASCRISVSEPLAIEERYFHEITGSLPLYRPMGCKACAYTGFLGRLPIVDIVEMTPRLRDAVALGEARLLELDKLRDAGLRSLAASGSLRVISGETTVREIQDTVGPTFWAELTRVYDKQGLISSVDTTEFATAFVGIDPGVLLVSEDTELAAALQSALAEYGFRLISVIDGEQAQNALQMDEEIVFTVLDIPPEITASQAGQFIATMRTRISWARLPGATLASPDICAIQRELLKEGLLTTLHPKPTEIAELVESIRNSALS